MLLVLHISVPVRILTASGISQLMPFLKLKFWYLMMPQLQVPLELLVFHLSMLALLERYKNSIGEMQHHWLAFVTSRMGLSKYMLPHDIEKFRMIGHIPISEDNSTVNQTLYELAIGMEDHEKLLLNNMMKVDLTSPVVDLVGETRDNGERLLDACHAYIALPGPKPPEGTHATTGEETKDGLVLLPTSMGRFRFKRRDDPIKDLAIEVWEEVPGKPIPRPPEGWDDLGVGGADIQGRWAWGAEKRSKIEQGVAHRPKVFGQSGQSRATMVSLSSRFILLLVLSWCATTLLLVAAVSTPLGIGRAIFFLLRVPDTHIHTPWVFAVGSLVAFPVMARLGSLAVSSSDNSLAVSAYRWIRSMRLPPQQKGRVVLVAALSWFCFCPLAVGATYELCLVKPSAWYAGEEELMDIEGLLLIWMVGSVLLNTWACLCSLSFFTKEFWVNLGNGIVEIEGERGRRENAAQDQQEGEQPFWQGKEGRIAKFFEVWKSILLRWEWDTVDPDVLLKECAFPVSKSLGVLLLVPSLCYSVWFCLIEATVGMTESKCRSSVCVCGMPTRLTPVFLSHRSFRDSPALHIPPCIRFNAVSTALSHISRSNSEVV
jgi:E3 ubiquitin-protein ligase MARCH6